MKQTAVFIVTEAKLGDATAIVKATNFEKEIIGESEKYFELKVNE